MGTPAVAPPSPLQTRWWAQYWSCHTPQPAAEPGAAAVARAEPASCQGWPLLHPGSYLGVAPQTRLLTSRWLAQPAAAHSTTLLLLVVMVMVG